MEKLLIYIYCILKLIVNGNIIATTTGPIRGKLVTEGNLHYYAYQGIPYAEPPEGSLRFLPPVPKTPWKSILDVQEERKMCLQPQSEYRRDQMSEDCLFLNVYVPANNMETIPVLVFVPGGAFKRLSSHSDIYGPQLLLQRNVIVITINYRLGALGFLSLNTKEAAGNAGIKDVLLALKWIKSNVMRFKGDPNKITLGGNSAGSALVHYLLLSRQSTGLFQRAILISGSVLSYRFLALHPKENALVLAQELGLKTNNTNELLEKLKQVDAFDIIEAQENMGKGDNRKGSRPFSPFIPSIEINDEHAIISEHPFDILRKGIPQNVPILVGANAQEGLKMLPASFKDPSLIEKLNDNFELCIPSNIEYPYGSYQSELLATLIRHIYFNGDNISNKTIDNYIQLTGDTQFYYPIDSWVKLHKERKDSNNIFYYIFSYDGGLNWSKLSNKMSYPGTCHADELGYIFKTKITEEKLKNLNSNDQNMLDKMLTLLTNFVKYGNPTPKFNEDAFEWSEYGTSRAFCLINSQPRNVYNFPVSEYLDFWYKIYGLYAKDKEIGVPMESKIVP